MNLPTLIVLLLVAVALFFALRSYLRGGRGSCSCGCSGSGPVGGTSSTVRGRDSVGGAAGSSASTGYATSSCHGCASSSSCPFCQR